MSGDHERWDDAAPSSRNWDDGRPAPRRSRYGCLWAPFWWLALLALAGWLIWEGLQKLKEVR